ncbi:aspartate/glutamate racemase family protein [Desulfovibrio sp. Huiquan2017]|uniref:aspartate/glutamate racemase family protein n=1 Tax=Desulfovibrio sp. Huiquan2017 TaxID=2816861 RepID=UPI001A9327DF|nr:aspartate/glutamate racemase family protein [Desulfovibrio sp. Huiquan2017]
MNDVTSVTGVIGGMGNEAMVDLAEKMARVPGHEKLNYVFYGNSRLAYKPHEVNAAGTDGDATERRKAATARHTAAFMRFLGCGLTGLACNSAHELFRTVMRGSPVRFVDMIEETARSMRGVQGRVLVMGVTSLVESNLYQDALRALGIEAVSPSADSQVKTMAAIYDTQFGIKTGQITEEAENLLCAVLADECQSQDCNHVILGCTELPLILTPEGCTRFKREGRIPESLHIVDASSVLAETLVSTPCPPPADDAPPVPRPEPETDWFPPASFRVNSLKEMASVQRAIFKQTADYLSARGQSVTGSYLHLPTLFLVGDVPAVVERLARAGMPPLSIDEPFTDTVDAMLEKHFASMA